MRVIPSITCLAIALAAWSGNSHALAADPPASSTREKTADNIVSGPTTEPSSTLLQAGAEPRRALRLHPKPGEKRTSTMTLKIAMEVQMGVTEAAPTKMPATTIAIDYTVNKVSAEGEITYEAVMTDTTVAEDSDAKPEIVQAMKTALVGVKGMSINGIMSSRGIVRESQVKMPPDIAPQTRQMMEQMKDAFSNTGVGFPQEPVGLGAKWELKQKVKSQGITLDQTTVYELLSLEGDRVKLKTTVTQIAANQQIQNPAMAGMTVDVVKLQSKGGGEVTADLAQLMPVQATMGMHNETAMAMNTGDEKTEMSIKMDMKVGVETK